MHGSLRAALIGVGASVLPAPNVFTQSPSPNATPLGTVEFTVFGQAVTPVDMQARGGAKSRTRLDKD